MDITSLVTNLNQIEPLAIKIQQQVYQNIGLPCSIGVSYNRFLAKMGSNFKKPMGITIITPSNFTKLLWPLAIHKMHGVGIKTAQMMISNNIHTIGDLANYPCDTLVNNLSHHINISSLKLLARGVGNNKVAQEQHKAKSIGQQTTLLQPCGVYSELKSYTVLLARSVAKSAIHEGVKALTIQLTLRYTGKNKPKINRQHPLPSAVNNHRVIMNAAIKLLDEVWDGHPVTLIGVALKNLHYQGWIDDYQMSIFDKPVKLTKIEIQANNIIKNINEKYQKRLLTKLKN